MELKNANMEKGTEKCEMVPGCFQDSLEKEMKEETKQCAHTLTEE